LNSERLDSCGIPINQHHVYKRKNLKVAEKIEEKKVNDDKRGKNQVHKPCKNKPTLKTNG